MANIPTITTERLLLRPMKFEDWPAYEEMMQSQRSEFMGGPYSTRSAWGMFCHDVAQWPLMGHGGLMIEDRDSGACYGQIGINHGPLFFERELGWLLYTGAEGKGYAFEAAAGMRDWAFQNLDLTTLVSYVHPDNLKSRNLAERLGAYLDMEAHREDPADLVFRYPCPK